MTEVMMYGIATLKTGEQVGVRVMSAYYPMFGETRKYPSGSLTPNLLPDLEYGPAAYEINDISRDVHMEWWPCDE